MKKKLTLTVKSRIVQEARKQQINISDFLEKWLGVYIIVNGPIGDLYSGYQEFFDAIVPLLEQFNCNVIIGKGETMISYKNEEQNYNDWVKYNIHLEPSGYFYVDWFEKRFKEIRKIDLEDLLPPKTILDNLFKTLLDSKKVNDRKVNEILLAEGIVNVLSNHLFGN